jgi:Fe-S-cluster containining protein
MIHVKSKKEEIIGMTHPCRCDACENSCNFGSGAFSDGEVEKLAAFLGISEKETREKYLEEIERFGTTRLKPKLERKEGMPYGKCTFYDKGAGCKIHEVKPLECKISMGCKDYGHDLIAWYHITHFLDTKNPESLRQFKTYLESGGKTVKGAEHKDIFDEKTLKQMESFEDIKAKRQTDWEKELGLKDLKDNQKKKGNQR